MKQHIVLIVLSVFIGIEALGQVKFRLNDMNSELVVKGTSSIHDWEMKAIDMDATMELEIKENSIAGISNVNFTMPAEKLKSENSIMDKKSWSALKSKHHKFIKLMVTSVSGFRVSGNSLRGTANGTISIAGQTKSISIPFTGNIKNGNTISIKGSEKVNMEDFDIEPPTAMMGTLKTGNMVIVEYNIDFVSDTRFTELLDR